MPENTLFSYRADASDKKLFVPDHPIWEKAEIADIERYWNGKSPIKEKGPAVEEPDAGPVGLERGSRFLLLSLLV